MKELYLKKLAAEDKEMWLEYRRSFKDAKILDRNPEAFSERLLFIEQKEKMISELKIYYLI